MKKLIAIILILCTVIVTNAMAELDVSSMTDQELKDMITVCSAELRARALVQEKGILLFEYDGIALYQTGNAEVNGNGLIIIPALIENDRDEPTCIAGKDIICNGWDIMANFGGTIQEHSKCKVDMIFLSGDAELKTLDDIYSLSFKWYVTSGTTHKTLYEDEEREEHRFW